MIHRYAPGIKVWQGEAGATSSPHYSAPISSAPWNSELTQCKWNARRMLGDLGHDVESAVFTICDFNHTGREINRKGLLRATADRKNSRSF